MISETGKPPNKYTIAMGELIRKAREDAGLSQEQLGEQIYRKRLAVSEMENGKVEISAWTLPLLAAALKKPITYFFPSSLRKEIPEESLTPEEQELIIHFRDIWIDEVQKIAIKQVKVLSEFDPTEVLLNSFDLAVEQDQLRKDLHKKKHAKRP